MKVGDWVYWGSELCIVISMFSKSDHVIIQGGCIVAEISRDQVISEDDACFLAYTQDLIPHGEEILDACC